MSNDQMLKNVGTNIQEKAALIWNVANTLVGLYKPHEYGLVILPMCLIKRFHDCLLPTHQKVLEAAEKFKRQMDQERQELRDEEQALEPRYAEIMAALIEKITGVICQDKKEVITYLIHQALNQLDKTKNVTLRVSKNDMLRVSGQKEELKKCLSDGVEFDITEDESLRENQCIIETDERIIDCSLDVQLQNLKDQIRMITIM